MPNLVFHVAIAYRDIGKLFERCKIFINTSDLEGFQNTFLPSWIRGVPDVAAFDPDRVIASHALGVSYPDVAATLAVVSNSLGHEVYRRCDGSRKISGRPNHNAVFQCSASFA